MMPLRIAVAGLGTVGSSVVSLLQKHAKMIENRAGRPLVITAVSARLKSKHNGLDLTNIDWVENPLALPDREDVDVVCELIGGDSGTAHDLCKKTLGLGKSVVTANKALLAMHGCKLALLAEEKNVALFCEAAVVGGVPIIKAMRESMCGNKVLSVHGILNGTSNYILDRMTRDGLDFDSALKDAQECGYAEADPSADIDGWDAAHKLSILSALAYGIKPDLKCLSVVGIRSITKDDIEIAGKLGYVIKHLGVSVSHANGFEQRVSPCLLPNNIRLAGVDGVTNAVQIHGDFVGDLTFIGAGAGGEATASAVVSDLIDVAKGMNGAVFGQAVENLSAAQPLSDEENYAARYLRVQIPDKAGLLDEIQAVLQQLGILVESVEQSRHQTDHKIMAVFIMHKINDILAAAALEKINQIEGVEEHPLCLRIEKEVGENNA